MTTRNNGSHPFNTDRKFMLGLREACPFILLFGSVSVKNGALFYSLYFPEDLVALPGFGVKDRQGEPWILPQVLHGLKAKPRLEDDLVLLYEGHAFGRSNV